MLSSPRVKIFAYLNIIIYILQKTIHFCDKSKNKKQAMAITLPQLIFYSIGADPVVPASTQS